MAVLGARLQRGAAESADGGLPLLDSGAHFERPDCAGDAAGAAQHAGNRADLLPRAPIPPRGGALAAALLFAVAPWAVIESRKIWAQDLLPFFTILFFIFAFSWLREGRWRHALAMAVTLSILNQVHYSSVALWPILLFLIWRRRSVRALKQLAVGAALYAVLWAPFAVVVLRGDAFAKGEYRPVRAGIRKRRPTPPRRSGGRRN